MKQYSQSRRPGAKTQRLFFSLPQQHFLLDNYYNRARRGWKFFSRNPHQPINFLPLNLSQTRGHRRAYKVCQGSQTHTHTCCFMLINELSLVAKKHYFLANPHLRKKWCVAFTMTAKIEFALGFMQTNLNVRHLDMNGPVSRMCQKSQLLSDGF
jgi:hypothetical protein